jgi:propanol-preferring alcohol dehydrogenase
MDYGLLFDERVIRTVTASTRRDGEELLAAATQAGVKVRTETFPLTEANRALALLKAGKIGGAGVLVIG